MQTTICPRCGNFLEPGEYVCSRCGTLARTEQDTVRRRNGDDTVCCPGCGRDTNAELRYCKYCGTALSAPVPVTVVKKRQGRLGLWLGMLAVAGAAVLAALFISRRPTVPPREVLQSDPPRAVDLTGTTETTEARLSQQQAAELVERTYSCGTELLEKDKDSFTFTCFREGKVRHTLGAVRVGTDGTLAVKTGMQSNITNIDPAEIDRIVRDRSSSASYACAVIDLNTGDLTGSERMREPMSASALVYIPILYTVSAQSSAEALAVDESVPIIAAGGRGSMRGMKKKSLPVLEMLQYTFLHNSNDASNSMLDFLGIETVNRVCADGGFESVSIANAIGKTKDNTENDNYVSAADLCAMLDAIYNAKTSAIDRSFLQQSFLHYGGDVNAGNGLGKNVQNTLYGCFNGFKEKKYNEVLWSERSGSAYAVAFMASGVGYEKLQKIAAELGSYVDGVMLAGAEKTETGE